MSFDHGKPPQGKDGTFETSVEDDEDSRESHADSEGEVVRAGGGQAFERVCCGRPEWGSEGRSLWLRVQPRTGGPANSRRRSARTNCALRASRAPRRSENCSSIGSKPSA